MTVSTLPDKSKTTWASFF